jgi:hypothetical protein
MLPPLAESSLRTTAGIFVAAALAFTVCSQATQEAPIEDLTSLGALLFKCS